MPDETQSNTIAERQGEDDTVTRTRERKQKARLISDKALTDLKLATLSVRPLRLAFLVNAHASREELLKYIVYSTSIWGGASNFFIPVRNSSISDSWWRALCDHDPDKVIFCNGTEKRLSIEISDQIQPYSIGTWSDNVAEHHKYGLDQFGNIPLRYVLRHIYEQVRPIEQSNIHVPKYAEDFPFFFCLAAQFGQPEEVLFDLYTEVLKAEPIVFDDRSLGRYLQDIARFEARLSPLNMTEYGLSPEYFDMGGVLGIVLVIFGDDAIVEDFCAFWNLRTATRMWSKGPIALPQEVLDPADNLRVLGEWCASHSKSTNMLTLVSASLGVERLIELRNGIRPFLPEQFRIDLWYDNFPFSQFRIYEAESREEIRVTGRALNLHVPRPSWWQQATSGMEWVVDIDLQDRSRIGAGYIVPKYSKLNHLLAGEKDPSNRSEDSLPTRFRRMFDVPLTLL